MKPPLVGTLLACVFLVATTACVEKRKESGLKYHRAKHGYNGGLTEMVDLARVEGFDKVLAIEDLAAFASKVPGAVGFTTHPNFESGVRYAHAVLWYTRLSPTQSSWSLYLFDETEARKHPGDAPKASAIAAAEARVSGKLKIAQELIDAGGPNGVKLSGDYEEKKVLALAVMRLGGSFQHTAEFGGANCGGCRSVVPGGTPSRCGLGVQNQNHWTCCGASENVQYCRYWALIKAEDDAEQVSGGAVVIVLAAVGVGIGVYSLRRRRRVRRLCSEAAGQVSIMKNMGHFISLGLLALTVGCTSPGKPPSSKIVGGGAQIDWQAPVDGTAILVERVTGKVVITKSLKAREDAFTFNLTVAEDRQLVERALGTVPPSPEFILYFVPVPTHE
jgi:hypothetical protein